MAVDRWPTEFIYASRRILTSIIEQDAAARSTSWRMSSAKFSKAGFEIGAERASADANIYHLIRQATSCISDSIGSIEDPGSTQYLQLTTHLYRRRLPLWRGWEKANSHEVSVFISSERFPGVGRVLLTLAGSTRNFLDAQGRDKSTALRTPSDNLGLYDIIDDALETDEGRADAEMLEWERRHYSGPYPDERFGDVVNILFGPVGATQPMERVEILLRVHHAKRDVDVHHWDERYTIGPTGHYRHGDSRATDRYALAIIGAPVWIAKSSDDDLEDLPGGLQRYQSRSLPGMGRWKPPPIERESRLGISRRRSLHHWGQLPPHPSPDVTPEDVYPGPLPHQENENWESFQLELLNLVSTAHHGLSVPATHPLARRAANYEAVFADLSQWVAYHASRFGPTPVQLSARTQPRLWRRALASEPTGVYGWIVPTEDPEAALVTTEGECFWADSRGESLADYGIQRAPQSLRAELAANMLQMVAHWWRDPG